MIASPLFLASQTYASISTMGSFGYLPETIAPSLQDAVFSSDTLRDQANRLSNLANGTNRKGDSVNVNFHFDNDAHVDDLVAFILLQISLGDRLRSVTVSHGDSIMVSALETYRKLFSLLGGENINLGAGQRDIRNHFPKEWRDISGEVNKTIPNTHFSLQSKEIKSSLEVLKETAQQGPVSLVTTGPLTNIAEWFLQYPQDISNIHSLVIMGGALRVAGNVDMSESSDGTAEWNFFANPESAEAVLRSGVAISLIPLDVAGQVPVSDDFLLMLSQSKTVHGQLAYQLWNFAYRRYNYFLWDVVAAIATIHPELFTFEEHILSVLRKGRAQGRLVEIANGSPCKVAVQMDTTAVLNKITELLNKT